MDHDGGHGAIELGAALILVVGGALLTARTVRTRQALPSLAASVPPGAGPRPERPGLAVGALPPASRSIVVMLATLSLGAGVIHLVAAPAHFLEIGDAAMGFLIAAAFQVSWALRHLGGPSDRTVALGIAGNLAIVAAWAWTRTIGLPVAGGAPVAEPVGFPDGASVAFELLLVAGLVASRIGRIRALGRLPVGRSIAAVAVVPVVGLVVILTSLASIAIASGVDHGTVPGGGAPEHAARR